MGFLCVAIYTKKNIPRIVHAECALVRCYRNIRYQRNVSADQLGLLAQGMMFLKYLYTNINHEIVANIYTTGNVSL